MKRRSEMFKVGILIDGQNSMFWKIDYNRLIEYVFRKYERCEPRVVIKNFYVCIEVDRSRKQVSEDNNKFLDFLTLNGYTVSKRKYRRGQKVDLDAKIGSELRKHSAHCDMLVLIAGDGDYLPVLQDLIEEVGQMFLIITERRPASSDVEDIEHIRNSNIEVEFLSDLGIYKNESGGDLV